MFNVEDIRAALERIIAETASDSDRQLIQRALLDGKIVFATGERDVAIGGGAHNSLIITGNNNKVYVEMSDMVYALLRERLFPSPKGLVPPFPTLIFIGREQALHDLKERLGVNKTTHQKKHLTVVTGWPGVGKTTLVGVIGHDPDVIKAFPDGILWTYIDQKPNLLSIMASWGRALGTNELLRAPTLKEATAQLATLLQRKRMLLIVDDVWYTAHAAPFQQACGNDCALLVTTRLPDVADSLTQDAESIYNLPVLSEENALELLSILAPSVASQHPDECRLLVRDIGCLPLAIQVAGRLLKTEARLGWGVKELLEEIRSGAKLIEAQAPSDRSEEGNNLKVVALLQRSTDLLDEATRERFAYLGAFAPKPATFDLDAMSAVWDVEDPKPTVRKLAGHGLLEPIGSGRFQMHALLVAHARSLCTP